MLCSFRPRRSYKERSGHLLERPVGRLPRQVRRYYANFSYQAVSWTKPRTLIAKVESHPGELCPRVDSIVTNLLRSPERVVAFHIQRGTTEQWIKADNAVRLYLHALAYNLGNFLRTLALP